MFGARRWLLAIGLLLPGLAGGVGVGQEKKPTLPESVSYYKDVRPVFQQHCQGCHQPAKAEGGYLMTGHADLLKKGDHDEPGVVPGKPDQSFLVKQIIPHDGKRAEMPRGK